MISSKLALVEAVTNAFIVSALWEFSISSVQSVVVASEIA